MKKTSLMRFRGLATTLTLATALLVAGCSSSGQTGSTDNGGAASSAGTTSETPSTGGKSGGTVTMAMESDIVSLDPAFSYDFVTGLVDNQITEGLLKFDKDSKLAPNLAEKWESPDDKTYLYYLRKDVTFQDGTPMTIDDVLFSMERIRDPKTASYVGWMYENVDKIEKVDDWTVKVTLSQPDANWQYVPATTGGYVISKKHYEANKANYGKPDGGVMGTGPFKYVSWQTGSEVILEKNPNYWDKSGGPYVDKLVYKVIPEGTTRITGLKTGQINMMIGLPLDLIDVVKKMDNVELDMVDSFLTHFAAINTQRKPFDDVKVRQAVNYALDKQKMLDQIIRDSGIPAKAVPIPPALWLFSKDKWEAAYKELPDYSYNLDKAKQLLAESSAPNGFSAKILTDGSTPMLDMALALQAAVKPLGINLEIEKVTGEELNTRAFGGARDYDIVMNSWGADYPDPSGNLMPVFHSGTTGEGGSNFGNYKNPELDKLLDEQSHMTDPDKRTELMLKAQKIIADESVWVVLDHPKQILTKTKNIEGYSITPLWYWEAFMKNVKLK
ncbi:MAG: ABC transporter substrate-binding protein [Clostridia bacterium]